jgi:hypothetical protein
MSRIGDRVNDASRACAAWKDVRRAGAVWLVGIACLAVAAFAAVGATPALAEVQCGNACSPWLHLSSVALPGNLPPGGSGEVLVLAQNLGDAPLSSEVILTDRLPQGVTPVGVSLGVKGVSAQPFFGEVFCKTTTSEVTCTVPGEVTGGEYGYIEIYIQVAVAKSAESGAMNKMSAVGGGSPKVSLEQPLAVSGAPTKFGLAHYEMVAENAGGSPDSQAGSHPFQLSTQFAMNQTSDTSVPPAALKDLHFNLPPGVIGNPTPFPQCPLAKFQVLGQSNFCPPNTVVGVASVTTALGGALASTTTHVVPLFALVPSVGEPARFGFLASGVPVYLDTSVRTGRDYAVTVSVDNITQIVNTMMSTVTFWGVPGDSRHDGARDWACLDPEEGGSCNPFGQESPPPLLTMPTACSGPVRTTLEADSWVQEGVFTEPLEYVFKTSFGEPMSMDGCNREPFTPSIKVTPDGQAGSTPTGLTVDEHVPQETDLNPAGLAESGVKGLSVTLPEGVALNPAGADGLQACSMEQIGLQSAEASSCPQASKVATAKIRTPLLPNPLEGAAYLATQNTNPFGSLVALYLYAEDPVSGIRAKATGEVVLNPVTGQATAHFENDPLFADDPAFAGEPEAMFLPEVPFEDVELHFFGGDRAPLVTPTECGSYTTTGTFTPWSGNPPVESSSQFDITSGPNGGSCDNPPPFAPTLAAGTTSIQAGGLTPFAMTMSRPDGSQTLQGIQLHMPQGLSGLLTGVTLCGEAQADAGTCGADSLIGETIVSVGEGGDPFTVTGGKVYLTGPYKGAPFGLSIVNPAKAGPFDLGSVVVRAKIEVDPETAALTITTDDEGPYKIPTILDGIPLEIRHVNVNINRPGFTFNPTNCNPLAVTGTLSSTQGATQPLSVPFQVTNCAVLAFKPKIQASTSGKVSRANGTSLNVKLSYPAGPYDANISRVKVELPKVLPSRLTTLRQACLASVFDANPANCPAASIIGHANATTPELPVPLSGPAYFVSHGGEAFPSLIIVLQGYGVTVHLVGTTFISKSGITSSTFKTVPDAPVGSFELNLPAGPSSALTGLGDLCKHESLAMPTEFIGQNGAEIHTTTKIAITGCAKARHKAKKTSKRRRPLKKAGGRHGRRKR